MYYHKIIILIIIIFDLFKPKTNSFIKKIKVALAANSIKNGGAERSASLICYYFNKVKIFKFFLLTLTRKEKNEYAIDGNIKRIMIKNNLIEIIKKKKIDILLYQTYDYNQINELNKIKDLKIILINRSCFLHWIYYNRYDFFRNYYKIYKKADYAISLIPFENDYLFRKWGINSILMPNFIPYKHNKIVPSSLSSNIILMIGRADDRIKRFDLGIRAMKYIGTQIPQSELKIISSLDGIDYLLQIIDELKLENFVKFEGYTSNPSIYYKNASLHLFPTLVEAFPNILSETKIYGIPNILIGLDYVTCANGGTVIIYDDSPLSLSKVIIKILRNKKYKENLGRDARLSMKNLDNNLILKRWIKIILSIHDGKENYQKLRNKDKKMADKDAIRIIENQLNLLKHRNKTFINITLNDIINFTFLENLK
jgi:hypothetical protein